MVLHFADAWEVLPGAVLTALRAAGAASPGTLVHLIPMEDDEIRTFSTDLLGGSPEESPEENVVRALRELREAACVASGRRHRQLADLPIEEMVSSVRGRAAEEKRRGASFIAARTRGALLSPRLRLSKSAALPPILVCAK